MNKSLAIIAIVAGFSCSVFADDPDQKIQIHMVGEVKEPGKHDVPTRCSLEELEAAIGGFTEWAAPAERLVIIRFPRIEGVTEGKPDPRKEQFLRGRTLPVENGKLRLMKGDLIYIPMQNLIGR